MDEMTGYAGEKVRVHSVMIPFGPQQVILWNPAPAARLEFLYHYWFICERPYTVMIPVHDYWQCLAMNDVSKNVFK